MPRAQNVLSFRARAGGGAPPVFCVLRNFTLGVLRIGVESWILLLIGMVSGPCIAAQGDSSDPALRQSVASLVQQYCVECHSDKKARGDVNLESMLGRSAFAADFESWERVVQMLEEGAMPPEKKPQPEDSQRRLLISVLRGELEHAVQRDAGDPGRVVLRRLTSAEYAYTILDLTGLALGLEQLLAGDAVGGEGFSNVGDVQFVQDSTVERYLDAAKRVASHALIGAGPLQFYPDPGRTGQELSAIQRIQAIYRRHGFRTGAGEGAEAFGLERYPRAFYAAWRYRFRHDLKTDGVTLPELAARERIEPGFLEHVWNVLNDQTIRFPASEIVSRWQALPGPVSGEETTGEPKMRAACDDVYRLLREWQAALAVNSSDDEESPVLTEGKFRPSLSHSFRVRVDWAPGAREANLLLSVTPVDRDSNPVVVWKQPRISFRKQDAGRAPPRPLKELISEETARRFGFGSDAGGADVGPEDFFTRGAFDWSVSIPVPEGSASALLTVDARLDPGQGDAGPVRCVISDGIVEGETVASTGASSALLADPDGAEIAAWTAGADEFARKLPQVSHREPAPSDRDPIPAPFDNTYNTPERNAFHYDIKYHRDDRFLTEHLLGPDAREALEQAWADLLSSFDYYGNYLRFVAKKFEIDLDGKSLADLTPEWIESLVGEPRSHVRRLHAEHGRMRDRLAAARAGHVDQAIRWAARAWRRPLSSAEEGRLRSFYRTLRDEAGMDHSEAVGGLLARILMAPAFLYKIESPRDADGIVPLTDWELASRLSYFLWSSLPDAELMRVAAVGELRDPDELVRQAQRMLRDPKARRMAAEFFGQWFGFYRFDQYRGVDTGRFPEFTDRLKGAMHDEAISFFEHLVREDRPVDEILFADHAFLNRELAKFYGVDGVNAPTNGLARFEGVGRFRRGGLLQLGAVLTVTSAPLRTSAVKRGDWVLRRVLGTPVPTPPADVGSIPADDVLGDGKTVRERLEAHRRDVSCVNCHSRMDPLGFALEHFDPIGRWRDTYRDGKEIDASGTLNDGTEISGLEALLGYLGGRKHVFRRNLCVKLLGYALGRSAAISDRPLIEQMTGGIEADPRFSSLVIRIVTSPQFRTHRGNPPDTERPHQTSFQTKDPTP